MHDPLQPPRAVPAPADSASAGGVRIRRMGLQDLSYVVAAHQAEFGDGFFARLGPRFLARYYRTFLDGPTAVAIIAEGDGAPCGYLTGVVESRRHRALLLRYHGAGLAAHGCVAMLRHPRLAFTFVVTRSSKYLRGVRHGLSSGAPSVSPSPEGRTAVLTHIVVDEPHRDRGVGSQLLNHFVSDAAESGCARAALVTATGTSGAASFYEAHGWTRCGSVSTPEGKPLWRYAISLPGGPVERRPDAR